MYMEGRLYTFDIVRVLQLPVRVHHIYALYVLRFCYLVSSHLTALCIFEQNMCDTTIICVCICIYVYIFCLYT